MNQKKKKKDYSLWNYRGALPVILKYQILSKIVLTLILVIHRQLVGLLLWNLGRPAFTSGDLPYLMRSWQGWALILVGFLLLIIYVIFDINAMILMSHKVIHNEPIHVFSILKEAALEARKFRSPLGLIVILYVALITPLTGMSLGISLTNGFAIPDFIMSFINDRLILNVLYKLLIVALSLLGFFHVFAFHFILMDDMDVKTALQNSRKIMRKYKWNFIKRYLIFTLKQLAVFGGMILLFYAVPSVLLRIYVKNLLIRRIGISFIALLTCFTFWILTLLFLYLLMMKLHLIFEIYTERDVEHYVASTALPYGKIFFLGILTLLVLLGISICFGWAFDDIFPKASNVQVIAHRAGGDLAHENTILGLEAAIKENADYAEIDVQRTKDHHYIINHDDTFERCCNDPRRPSDLTLEEAKQLEVTYAINPTLPPTEVATIEEFLDHSKDRIQLLIELKGNTADSQMVEDLYQMVKDRDMIDQVMFIGLNYNLLDYVERTHPEIKTGYLCFFGFGHIQDMNVDVLLLESETATDENIDRIHASGKKVGVWTVDNYFTMAMFMISDADYIITDKVAETNVLRDIMHDLPDEARILEFLLPR